MIICGNNKKMSSFTWNTPLISRYFYNILSIVNTVKICKVIYFVYYLYDAEQNI